MAYGMCYTLLQIKQNSIIKINISVTEYERLLWTKSNGYVPLTLKHLKLYHELSCDWYMRNSEWGYLLFGDDFIYRFFFFNRISGATTNHGKISYLFVYRQRIDSFLSTSDQIFHSFCVIFCVHFGAGSTINNINRAVNIFIY